MNDVAGGTSGEHVDAVLTIARNDVASACHRAADGVVGNPTQDNPVAGVTERRRAISDSADAVALHHVASGGQRRHENAGAIARNDIARARRRAANRVVGAEANRDP